MSAPVHSQTTDDDGDPGSGAPLLRTGAAVTVDGAGRLLATLQLHGDLCPTTAGHLRHEVERLIEDGVVELTVDLVGLRMCTSHGLEIWQEADERLRRVGGGVRLVGASGIVQQVLDVVVRADPSFSPTVHRTDDGGRVR